MENNTPKADPALLPEAFSGEAFKTARHSKQMSVRDVAGELHILTRHIESIELERWDDLPHSAFTRGFISNYASLLGLDATRQVLLYDSMVQSNGTGLKDELDKRSPVKPDASIPRSSRQLTAFGRGGLVLGALALLILAALYFVTDLRVTSGPDDELELTPSSSPIEGQDTMIEITEPAGASMTQQITMERQQAIDPEAAGTPANLEFWVIRPTQIKLTDATGAVLIDALQPRGALNIEAIPPVHLVVDQIQNVDLNIDSVPQRLRQQYGAGETDVMLSAP